MCVVSFFNANVVYLNDFKIALGINSFCLNIQIQLNTKEGSECYCTNEIQYFVQGINIFL